MPEPDLERFKTKVEAVENDPDRQLSEGDA